MAKSRFVWRYSETVDTRAAAECVWSLWSNPVTWALWDDSVKSAFIHGDFIQGTKGVMLPKSGPKVVFELSKVDVNKAFTNRAKLPLATLDFFHTYTPSTEEGMAQVTHGVEIRGLFAPLFGFLIGRGIKKHLRASMLKLTEKAVQFK